jgi:hypothetical protein
VSCARGRAARERIPQTNGDCEELDRTSGEQSPLSCMLRESRCVRVKLVCEPCDSDRISALFGPRCGSVHNSAGCARTLPCTLRVSATVAGVPGHSCAHCGRVQQWRACPDARLHIAGERDIGGRTRMEWRAPSASQKLNSPRMRVGRPGLRSDNSSSSFRLNRVTLQATCHTFAQYTGAMSRFGRASPDCLRQEAMRMNEEG